LRQTIIIKEDSENGNSGAGETRGGVRSGS